MKNISVSHDLWNVPLDTAICTAKVCEKMQCLSIVDSYQVVLSSILCYCEVDYRQASS